MVYTSEFTKPVRGEIDSRRRRRWTAAEKGRIVAEAVAPGAVMAVVAHRHDLTPQHLSNWVMAAKCGCLILLGIGESGAIESDMAFVPVIAAEPTVAGIATGDETLAPVEIAIGSYIVRVRHGANVQLLESVVRAIGRALA
jgi:transposase